MHVFLIALSFINVFVLRKPFASHYDLLAKYIYLHILEELVRFIITVCLVRDLGQGGRLRGEKAGERGVELF